VIAVGLGAGWRPEAGAAAWVGAAAVIVGFILAMSWLAAARCAGILVAACAGASWLFRHRTAA